MAINHTFLPQAQHKKVRFIAEPLGTIKMQTNETPCEIIYGINTHFLLYPI